MAQVGELLGVFLAGSATIWVGHRLVGGSGFARHAVVCAANLLMLVLIWQGLLVRGQDCRHFGLSFRAARWRTVARTVSLSFLVLVAALAVVVLSGAVIASLVGVQAKADLSGYSYLNDSLLTFAMALAAVYVNASFGEEVIYRGFLIHRIAELGGSGTAAWRWAVVISSIAFGLVHSDWAWPGIVQMGCMGLVLGVSYLCVGRNLWVTILAHAYLDTILLLQVYFTVE